MTPALVGQLLGIAFACGLNLYITVAALGILARFGVIGELPPGLLGLKGLVVIGSALVLYAIEAVIDRIRHVDSLWDSIHTFIRPPAAALLAVGALWTAPLSWKIAGAIFAFIVALAAHATKAGFRLAINTAGAPGRPRWTSFGEDVAAVALAVAALEAPATALVAGGVALVLIIAFGRRFFRAFMLGMHCLAAWLRALFSPARWREADELPGDVRALLDASPLGTAPPRGARVGISGLPGVGMYRSGWLVATATGPVFIYRARFRIRRVDLPATRGFESEPGAWADLLRIDSAEGRYTLYLLKDGPTVELAIHDLHLVST